MGKTHLEAGPPIACDAPAQGSANRWSGGERGVGVPGYEQTQRHPGGPTHRTCPGVGEGVLPRLDFYDGEVLHTVVHPLVAEARAVFLGVLERSREGATRGRREERRTKAKKSGTM